MKLALFAIVQGPTRYRDPGRRCCRHTRERLSVAQAPAAAAALLFQLSLKRIGTHIDSPTPGTVVALHLFDLLTLLLISDRPLCSPVYQEPTLFTSLSSYSHSFDRHPVRQTRVQLQPSIHHLVSQFPSLRAARHSPCMKVSFVPDFCCEIRC